MKRINQKIHGHKGFTLVELIVVLALLSMPMGALAFGAVGWIRFLSFRQQNEYARTLFVAAQNHLAEYSSNGRLHHLTETLEDSDADNLTEKIRDGEILDSEGIPFDLSQVWPESQNKEGSGDNADHYRSTIYSIIGTADFYQSYLEEPSSVDADVAAMYDLLSDYVYDRELLMGTICLELSPEDGQVFGVFYSNKTQDFTYTDTSDTSGVVSIRSRSEAYAASLDDSQVAVEAHRGHVGGIVGNNRRTGYVRRVATGKNWSVFANNNSTDNGTGGIMGYQASELGIENCINRAKVEKTAAGNGVGGMIGRLECATKDNYPFSHCINYGAIAGNQRVGGMVGVLKYYGTTVSDCINYGPITSRGGNGAAGIIDFLYQPSSPITFLRCENHGTLKELGSAAVAGIVAYTYEAGAVVKLRDCVNTGLLLGGTTAKSGGIIGFLSKTYSNTSEVINCRNYGWAMNSGNTATANVAGITPSGLGITKYEGCMGISPMTIRAAPSGFAAANKSLIVVPNPKDTSTAQGVGVKVGVEAQENDTFRLVDAKGATVHLPGFHMNPLSITGNEAKVDSLGVLGGSDNLRYQTFVADDPYFAASVADPTLTLAVPDNVSWDSSFTAKWSPVPDAEFYNYVASFYDENNNLLTTREDIIYDNSVANLFVNSINGTTVRSVTIRVRAGANTVVDGKLHTIWSDFSEDVRKESADQLPAPRYHLELTVSPSTNQLMYRAVLDNREEYQQFSNAHPGKADMKDIMITISSTNNDYSFSAYDGRSSDTALKSGNGWSTTVMFYANAGCGDFTPSSTIIRESLSPTHGEYVTSTPLITAQLTAADGYAGAGFHGASMNNLAYQIQINSAKSSGMGYARTELMARDMELGIPVSLSNSVVRLNKSSETRLVTDLTGLPADLTNTARYTDMQVRSYFVYMSNNVVFNGHTVVDEDSGKDEWTAEELKTLYVTKNQMVTTAPNATPLIAGGKVASGFVVEWSGSGYTLYFNALLYYNDTVAKYTYPSNNKTTTQHKNQVYYYNLPPMDNTQPVPVIHYNDPERKGVDGDPNSYWSDEDESAEATLNYRWVQLPRVQVAAPKVEKSLTPVLYDAKGRPTDYDNGNCYLLDLTTLSFPLVNHAELYRVEMIRNRVRDGRFTGGDPRSASFVDWLYMEDGGDGSYKVYYATSNPAYTHDQKAERSRLTEPEGYLLGTIRPDTSLTLPSNSFGKVDINGDDTDFVSSIAQLSMTSDDSGESVFHLLLPDTERIDGQQDKNDRFVGQVTVQAVVSDELADRYEDSLITGWSRTSDGTKMFSLRDYAEAPLSPVAILTPSLRSGIQYELSAVSDRLRVYEITIGQKTFYRSAAAFEKSGIALLENEACTDNGVLAKPWNIQVRAANILPDGGLSKWAIVFGSVLLHTPAFLVQVDKMLVHLPMIGPLLKTIYTARFARSLSSLYSAGLPIVVAMHIARKTIGNLYIDTQFTAAIQQVRSGELLSVALREIDGFNKKMASSIMVGEETGSLDSMLDSMADALEYESEMAIQQLVTMIEPLMIVIMAVIVGFIVLAIITPIYGSYNSIENYNPTGGY